ncbi:MAG: hypothetical protein A3G27_06845 [Betaproteobacteria bacterium RIFCSPLOWO2_12_FULL_66_14]|nr:MAG: hypothetical protein A3G27_06845 [Betaproteobacteria bacterium RIFCSPLOWO2_12_FULL_66_14]
MFDDGAGGSLRLNAELAEYFLPTPALLLQLTGPPVRNRGRETGDVPRFSEHVAQAAAKD